MPVRFHVNDSENYWPQDHMQELWNVWYGSGYQPSAFSVKKAEVVYRAYLTKQRLLEKRQSL
jgi:hypothetical protein